MIIFGYQNTIYIVFLLPVWSNLRVTKVLILTEQKEIEMMLQKFEMKYMINLYPIC